MRHRGLSLIWGSLLLAACSTAQPILYPNAHMQSVGKETAAQDIEACRKLAESAGAEGEAAGKPVVWQPVPQWGLEPARQRGRWAEPSQVQRATVP